MLHYIAADLEGDWVGWAVEHEYDRLGRLLTSHAEFERRHPKYRCECGSRKCHDCRDLSDRPDHHA